MKAYKVYEYQEFTRSNDVKSNLNIGKRQQIINWFNKMELDVNYEITEDLEVIIKGDLDLYNLYRAEEFKLPFNNLYVKGWLDLYNCNIKKLPEKLNVGKLDLRRSNVTQLPNDLIVRELLDIRLTKITEIPPNASIKGIFQIEIGKIVKMPKNLEAKIYY